MNELLSRVALGGVVLALAAAVVVTTGSGGLRGSLGSLFGYRSQVRPFDAAAAVLAQPPLPAPRAVASVAATAHLARVTRPVRRRHAQARVPARRPATSIPVSYVPPPPPPASAPAPPAPAPAPVPKPGQGAVGQAVASAAALTAPIAPAQPAVQPLVGAVAQTCGLLGGCT